MLDSLLSDASTRFPQNTALIFEDKSYTYAELSRLTQDLAAGLIERGIRSGDRVAFLLSNGLEIVLCYYACFRVGALAVPLNLRFQPELLLYVINHSGARILVSQPDLFSQIEKIRSSLWGIEEFYLTSRHSEFTGVRPFNELLADASDLISPTLSGHSPAAIYYTSGTTGLPKAVVHSHAGLTKATELQIDQISISPADTTVILFSLCYLIGFGSQILPFHHSGARCVLLPEFRPEAALAAIETYQVTKIYGFPKLYNELINYPEVGSYNVKSLNFCFSAGEAMAVAIQERFKQLFGVEITEGCGMTELQIYSMNPPYGKKKKGSIGRPIAGMELSLIDDSGRSIVIARQVGEMIVRGESMTVGYWRDASLTSNTIREGWFHTGDLAYKDEQGFYWFVSRKSEIIQHEAGLVSPIEVEGALYEHPAVLEAGVIGVPDKFGGELPEAYVVLKKGGRSSDRIGVSRFCQNPATGIQGASANYYDRRTTSRAHRQDRPERFAQRIYRHRVAGGWKTYICLSLSDTSDDRSSFSTACKCPAHKNVAFVLRPLDRLRIDSDRRPCASGGRPCAST